MPHSANVKSGSPYVTLYPDGGASNPATRAFSGFVSNAANAVFLQILQTPGFKGIYNTITSMNGVMYAEAQLTDNLYNGAEMAFFTRPVVLLFVTDDLLDARGITLLVKQAAVQIVNPTTLGLLITFSLNSQIQFSDLNPFAGIRISGVRATGVSATPVFPAWVKLTATFAKFD